LTGADGIHPGYGFLSESAYFAEAAESCGVTFIGPSIDSLRLLGDKASARSAMKKAGVPILPGTADPPESVNAALKASRRLGFPLIIKASAGGGGRGMRIVYDPSEIETAWTTAQREAAAAFGDGTLYLEKYIEAPRHIEFQIIADRTGNVVHLGERECSIQRRHQKLIEEAPSTVLTDRQRRKLGKTVVNAARAVGYQNAGTFEFLMDEKERFYFLEANTRLQVEHPVTEMVTGIDIVKEQIRIASGETLSFRQDDVVLAGHAIECRINAESSDTFRPSPGTIRAWSVPGGPGIRLDTAAHNDCIVSPHYDSLVAKLIAHGEDRAEAIARMQRALAMTVVEGIDTTVPLFRKIFEDEDFIAARLSTSFMDRFSSE
jgi:acetyl-CoA carboxylase biotin carboxylase subunit